MPLRSAAPAALLLMVFAPGETVAQTPAPQGSALVRALAACRGMSDSVQRLACYDAAAGRLEAAERTGEVVVVDREQARAARRQAFGLSLPSLNILNRGVSDDELNRLSLVVDRASQAGDGKWIVRTQDGQVWRQIDTTKMPKEPRRGSKAEVRRAAVGSYFMNIDGQRALRVRREQ
jgi:hypothetical protein